MLVNFGKFCDRCGKRIKDGTGAEVLKYTVGMSFHPTRHMCEKCYAEVFEKQIKKERMCR